MQEKKKVKCHQKRANGKFGGRPWSIHHPNCHVYNANKKEKKEKMLSTDGTLTVCFDHSFSQNCGSLGSAMRSKTMRIDATHEMRQSNTPRWKNTGK